MNTQDIVENWRQEAVQEGVAQAVIDIYELRFGSMPDDIRAVIEDTHDKSVLRTWLKLAGGSTVDEVSSVIRASRPS